MKYAAGSCPDALYGHIRRDWARSPRTACERSYHMLGQREEHERHEGGIRIVLN